MLVRGKIRRLLVSPVNAKLAQCVVEQKRYPRVPAESRNITAAASYRFNDSITAGCVIFPARTFRPIAKPGSAASAASTPMLASA